MDEKETFEIVLQAKLAGVDDNKKDGRDASHFRDRRVFLVGATREEIAKILSEFSKVIDERLEQ